MNSNAFVKMYNPTWIKKMILMVIGLLALSLFFPFKFLIFLLVISIFNAHVAKFNFRNGLPTEIELSTFSTIIIASVFGLPYGIFNAIFSKLVANLATGSFIVDHIFMIANYCIAAFIGSMFNSIPIFYLGVFIISLNNITMFFISKYLLAITLPRNLSYALSNYIFNFLVFLIFSEFVIGLIN